MPSHNINEVNGDLSVQYYDFTLDAVASLEVALSVMEGLFLQEH